MLKDNERCSCSSNFYDLDPLFVQCLNFVRVLQKPTNGRSTWECTKFLDHPTDPGWSAPMSSMMIPLMELSEWPFLSLTCCGMIFQVWYNVYIYIHIPNHSIPYHTITVQYITYMQSNTQEDRWVIDNDVGIGFYHFYLFRGCYFCIYTVYGITPLVDL